MQHFGGFEVDLAELLIHLTWGNLELFIQVVGIIRDLLKANMEVEYYGTTVELKRMERTRLVNLLIHICKVYRKVEREDEPVYALFEGNEEQHLLEYLTLSKAHWRNKRHFIYLMAKLIIESPATHSYISEHRNIIEVPFGLFIAHAQTMQGMPQEAAETRTSIEVFS